MSGTGTMFRVSILRQVAAGRGHRLPGIAGEVHNVRSITEDDEITLAIKTLGLRCLTVYGCETTTEVMPGWTALWTQRPRRGPEAAGWIRSVLTGARRDGLIAVLWFNYADQLGDYKLQDNRPALNAYRKAAAKWWPQARAR